MFSLFGYTEAKYKLCKQLGKEPLNIITKHANEKTSSTHKVHFDAILAYAGKGGYTGRTTGVNTCTQDNFPLRSLWLWCLWALTPQCWLGSFQPHYTWQHTVDFLPRENTQGKRRHGGSCTAPECSAGLTAMTESVLVVKDILPSWTTKIQDMEENTKSELKWKVTFTFNSYMVLTKCSKHFCDHRLSISISMLQCK